MADLSSRLDRLSPRQRAALEQRLQEKRATRDSEAGRVGIAARVLTTSPLDVPGPGVDLLLGVLAAGGSLVVALDEASSSGPASERAAELDRIAEVERVTVRG